jgi:hypothetical protein
MLPDSNQPFAYAAQIHHILSQMTFVAPRTALCCCLRQSFVVVKWHTDLQFLLVYGCLWLLQFSIAIDAMSLHIASKDPFADTVEDFSSRRLGFDPEIAFLAAEMYLLTLLLGDRAEVCCLPRGSRSACDECSSTSEA